MVSGHWSISTNIIKQTHYRLTVLAEITPIDTRDYT